ncbi:MAG: hypothetical protein LBB61_08420 [Treponema sp.]|nr:hypothetical protein [Treponema sp.]
MLITIDIRCPHCHSPDVTRNGKKSKGKQNRNCIFTYTGSPRCLRTSGGAFLWAHPRHGWRVVPRGSASSPRCPASGFRPGRALFCVHP